MVTPFDVPQLWVKGINIGSVSHEKTEQLNSHENK